MGAWGYGPFDSDQSLDYLGDLAHQHARTDDNHDIVPGSVNREAVLAELRRALSVDLAAAATEKILDEVAFTEAYAAAGLVAAAVTGKTADTPSGTRLFARIDGTDDTVENPLGLDHHCGYVALLTAADATALVPAARAAATAMAAATLWHRDWSDPARMKSSQDALVDTLSR